MFFLRGAIFKIPQLLEIWRDPKTDPKTDNIMYMKDVLRDWSSPHLLDYGWYLNCLNVNTPPSKFEIWEKYEPTFLQGLGALEKGTPTKKKMEGGMRKGKRQMLESTSEM